MMRPYQSEAIRLTRAHWHTRRNRVCVVLPTGAGKTVVAQALLSGARAPLAVVHTGTLLEQTLARTGIPTVTIQAALEAGGLPFTPDVVFVDECHHYAAGRWRALFDWLARIPGVLVVGCTATPERADGAPLGDLFDAMVATARYSELLANGWLAPCDVFRMHSTDPVEAYFRFHSARGRAAILFRPTIEACTTAVESFQRFGVRAACITADTPRHKRKAIVKAFDAGRLDLLASPMALSEGFDSPRAKVCILDRSCIHVGTYLQSTNRVTRPYRGERATLLDLSGASERHGSPVDDRVYSLEGTAIGRASPSRPAPRRSGVVPRSAPESAGASLGRTLRKLWGALWAA